MPAEAPVPAAALEPTEASIPELDADALAAYIDTELNSMIDDGRFILHSDIYSRPIEIEIANAEPKSISIRAYYADVIFGLQSEEITGLIVQLALDWLVSEGQDPYAEWIGVHGHGYFPETGATGQQLLMTWGSSHYDWNIDSIVWKAE